MREVEVSRPDKLLWPDAGITKQVYVDYLGTVSAHMLPWLRRRPLTMVRATALVASRRPELVTAEFRRADRAGRVMLDPSRNGTGATIVAPYSPRARPEARVSFPVLPEELRSITPGDFTLRSVPGLLDGPGPCRWMDLADERGRLPRALLHDPG